MSRLDLVIVGPCGGTHVGGSLCDGARQLGLHSEVIDTAPAMDGPSLLVKFNWHLRGHRPVHLGRFSAHVVERCARVRPRHLLSVGIAPIAADAVRALRGLGVETVNYLTDDPWSPAHRSRWALQALSEYDRIASPRRSNMQQLRALGRADVFYVPFGYDPRHCFAEAFDAALASDVIFVGGADADRLPWIQALSEAGIDVAVYGGYWDRYRATRALSRGNAKPAVIRRATASAKLALCLVRRTNRDGHVMRSLEIPAIGACMLVEDTDEHRALFGPDGEAVVYFRTPVEMLRHVRHLLAHDGERQRLAGAVHARITAGHHRYSDRLAAMLSRRGES